MGIGAKLAAAQAAQAGAPSQAGHAAPPQQQGGVSYPAMPPQQGGYSQPPYGAQAYGQYPPSAYPVGPPPTGWGQAPQWQQPGGGPPPAWQQWPQPGAQPSWVQGPPPQNSSWEASFQQAQQPAHTFDVNTIRFKLQKLVQENGLQAFYPPQRIDAVAHRAASQNLGALQANWRLPHQMVLDLTGLALYDVIVYVDDSGSMAFQQWNGERIADLKAILGRVAECTCLFDDDGISVRFMNSNSVFGDNIRTASEASALVERVRFEGMTPLGTELERKVLRPFLYEPAKRGQLPKPLMILSITDGEPTNEPRNKVRHVIGEAKNFLKGQTRYGSGAVGFQFAQVGQDAEATRFLDELDSDHKIGKMVDVVSYYELEAQQTMQSKGIHLTPDMYLVKMMIGSIDQSYDASDEGPKKGGLFKRMFS